MMHDVCCGFSVAGNETTAPVPDTAERAHGRDRAVRPEVRQRAGRREREQQVVRAGEPEAVGEQDGRQDDGEPELHGVADHDMSERAQPPAAQDVNAIAPDDVPKILIILLYYVYSIR